MTSYLERYHSGEHEQVWRELSRLGELAGTGALLADARAVAHETIRRVRHNIEVLLPRLEQAGYVFGFRALGLEQELPGFAAKYRAFAPPPPEIGNHLDALEQQVGPLPLALRAWYETVGDVNLVGRPPDSWQVRPYTLDPFQVDPLELVTEIHDLWLVDQAYSCSLPDAEKDADEIAYFAQDRLDVMLDVDTKFGYSGLGAYQIAVPSSAVDTLLIGHAQGLTFVEYLRLSCRWGGFPGLEFASERPDDVIQLLTAGLSPV